MNVTPLEFEEWVERLAKKASFLKGDTKILLLSIKSLMKELVAEGRGVKQTGFGKLTITIVPEHEGYDAVNGRRVMMPESKRVTLKLSGGIKRAEKYNDNEEFDDD